MVVGESKTIDVAFLRNCKCAIGTTENISKFHLPTPFGSEANVLGNQQSFWTKWSKNRWCKILWHTRQLFGPSWHVGHNRLILIFHLYLHCPQVAACWPFTQVFCKWVSSPLFHTVSSRLSPLMVENTVSALLILAINFMPPCYWPLGLFILSGVFLHLNLIFPVSFLLPPPPFNRNNFNN